MKNFTIVETDELYTRASQRKIYTHEVYQEALHVFCQNIRSLEKELGEQVYDEYWKELFRELKTFRFTLYAAPTPVNFQSTLLLQILQKKLNDCQNLFPSFWQKLKIVIDSVYTLTNTSDNPLLTKILELMPPEKMRKTVLLLKEDRFALTVEKILQNHSELQHLELINKYQLRGAYCYDRILAIGPHYWFPEYVFNAPRANEIHYIRYSWVSDTWEVKPLFIQATTSPTVFDHSMQPVKKSMKNVIKGIDEKEHLEQEDIPEINWSSISTKLLKNISNDRSLETVPAKLVLLANNHAVFLEASDNTKTLALDLEDERDENGETQQVKRILVTKLQSGMFLLQRTGGGGDYIVPIANAKLGKNANRYREKQAHWKELLRQKTEAADLLTVCVELLDEGGSENTTEINLRHWLSSKNIRPRNDEDFKAILKLVGLQAEEKMYLEAANKIKAAHKSAGMYLRDLLIKQVAKTDLHEIQKKGYLEIDLPKFSEVSISAFRIEHIEPDSTEVPYSHIGRLTMIKDE
ncbi:DISARM anti-phage system protein DrmE domain-containing protein [Tengunoibacter tsumagoiensis]|uniref:DISARM protein DrmE C-terminal domain-containing protein n=1 Tax=Tengunoibacter tsumagoiensis TaxID=2014871 RepID=A0A402A071_9CHLR|nr:hypothetical protein [Tengunoibacter tsumagoiensis]GCE12504.1 hypothetical protein KTT_23630 [Tengunoibacter tsumagoiensis]